MSRDQELRNAGSSAPLTVVHHRPVRRVKCLVAQPDGKGELVNFEVKVISREQGAYAMHNVGTVRCGLKRSGGLAFAYPKFRRDVGHGARWTIRHLYASHGRAEVETAF